MLKDRINTKIGLLENILVVGRLGKGEMGGVSQIICYVKIGLLKNFTLYMGIHVK